MKCAYREDGLLCCQQAEFIMGGYSLCASHTESVLPSEETEQAEEGWIRPRAKHKYHYFRRRRGELYVTAICSGGIFDDGRLALVSGNNDSPDNCVGCKRRLAVMKQRKLSESRLEEA